MSLLLPLFALIAALSAALVALLSFGASTAVVVLVVSVVLLLAASARGGTARGLAFGVSTVAVAGLIAFGGYHAWQIGSVLAATGEEADPADPEHLELALSKGRTVAAGGDFSLELSEGEVTALAQHALAQTEGHPVRSVEFTALEGGGADRALLGFDARFKGSSATASGTMELLITGGQLDVEVVDASFGMIAVPSGAHSAFEDVTGALLSLNDQLDALGVKLDHVEGGAGRIVVLGEQRASGM